MGRDTTTHTLRYIMELDASENGAACGCACISCGHPLQAVNAGKSVCLVRPHFRHEAGAETSRCYTLAARAALLASLQEGDWIELPRLHRSVNIVGLSGTAYDGWIRIDPRRVKIHQLAFVDITTAEVVLEDGRRLRVSVTGTVASIKDEAGACTVPRIEIATDDPQLAAMDPIQLRAMLIPAIAHASWCGYWPEPELEAAAKQEARMAALEALDWDEEDPGNLEQLSSDLRRESVLHRAVKAILVSAQSILLPGWRSSTDPSARNGNLLVTVSAGTTLAMLAGARLEKKLGRIIPDVIAEMVDGSELLVEVTVTNAITPERLGRIREVNLPTIEIDFSHMSGILRRDRLCSLVLEEVTAKLWLHHPDAARLSIAPPLDDVLLCGPRTSGNAAARRDRILRDSPEACGVRYLYAVRELAQLENVIDRDAMWDWEEACRVAYDDVLKAADELHLFGFPEALDYRLFDNGHTVLHRLLSIEAGSPVGYKYGTVWQVINTMLTDRGDASRSWHGLYLIALNAYPPPLTQGQEKRIERWRTEVRSSLQARETLYLRDPRYDLLCGLLFPKMLLALDKPGAKKSITTVPAVLIHGDDRHIDPGLFSPVAAPGWHWTTSQEERIRHLEIAASKARLDGWSVDTTSALRQFSLARFGPYPWIVVDHVALKTGVDDIFLWRYLYREGYISREARIG